MQENFDIVRGGGGCWYLVFCLKYRSAGVKNKGVWGKELKKGKKKGQNIKILLNASVCVTPSLARRGL